MTHMHIPDGILPVWTWISGFILMALFLGISLFRLRSMDKKKKIPLLGALSAVMLVAMSLEILPIAYHLNLSVVTGILLGPALGFVAAFIVNLMLALIGHGGISVMGLNTLLLGSETVLGHALFHLLRKGVPVFQRAALATILALLTVSLILIAIVGVSQVAPPALDHEGVKGATHEAAARGRVTDASLSTFAIMVLSLGSLGWLLEGAITGAVIQFISRVKPDLLAHTLHVEASRAGNPARSGL